MAVCKLKLVVLLDLVEGAYRHPKLDNFCPGFCQGKNFWTIFEGLRTPLIKDCGTIPLSKLNSNAMTLVNTTNVPYGSHPLKKSQIL